MVGTKRKQLYGVNMKKVKTQQKPTDKKKQKSSVKKIDKSKASKIKGGVAHGGWDCQGSPRV